MSSYKASREIIKLHKQGRPPSIIARMTGEPVEDVKEVIRDAWEDDIDMSWEDGSAFKAGVRAGRMAGEWKR